MKRSITHGKVEQRLGLNYTQEKVVQNENNALELERKSRALVASIGWTWRDVDDVFAPRKGQRAPNWILHCQIKRLFLTSALFVCDWKISILVASSAARQPFVTS